MTWSVSPRRAAPSGGARPALAAALDPSAGGKAGRSRRPGSCCRRAGAVLPRRRLGPGGRMSRFALFGPVVDNVALTFGPRAVPLSVLDLAPVPDGGTAGGALRATIDLARHAERLGFRRFWVAEHHNMPGIASSAPPVLIGHIADATESIRVGSGGVMLPNHVSLVVAEQFGMLEALHPGRIDPAWPRAGHRPGHGGGAAPLAGGAVGRRLPRTADGPARLLHRPLAGRSPVRADHRGAGPRQPAGHVAARLERLQRPGGRPLGLPFAFAHHFSPETRCPRWPCPPALPPSEVLERPYAMVAAAVVCAETDERGRWLAGSARCRSCGFAPAGQDRCPHPRRRPPTLTPTSNARSSRTAGPPALPARRRPSSAGSPIA